MISREYFVSVTSDFSIPFAIFLLYFIVLDDIVRRLPTGHLQSSLESGSWWAKMVSSRSLSKVLWMVSIFSIAEKDVVQYLKSEKPVCRRSVRSLEGMVINLLF